jgi:hypothetical protein
MEDKKSVLSDEVIIRIIDSVKEILLELIKRILPANI